MKSLLLKLAMVAVTIGLVYWIGWPLSGPHHAGPSPAAKRDTLQVFSKEVDHGSQRSIQLSSPGPETTRATTALAGSSHVSVGQLLDLNRAKVGDLEALPGIGAVLAQRVITFRESVGGFRSIEELRGVKGIGAKKFDRLKPLVTVSTVDQRDTTERRI